jgi:hypothetical protein
MAWNQETQLPEGTGLDLVIDDEDDDLDDAQRRALDQGDREKPRAGGGRADASGARDPRSATRTPPKMHNGVPRLHV